MDEGGGYVVVTGSGVVAAGFVVVVVAGTVTMVGVGRSVLSCESDLRLVLLDGDEIVRAVRMIKRKEE